MDEPGAATGGKENVPVMVWLWLCFLVRILPPPSLSFPPHSPFISYRCHREQSSDDSSKPP